MRYNKQKLQQMSLDELRGVAAEFQIADADTMDAEALVAMLVDAQAAQALNAYQAREEAMQPKRRARITVSSTPAAQRVETRHMKGERVLATVGSEENTLSQMQEAQAQQPLPVGVRRAQRAMEQFIQQNDVIQPMGEEISEPVMEPVADAPIEQPVAASVPVVEAEVAPAPKKRGRPRKNPQSETDDRDWWYADIMAYHEVV